MYRVQKIILASILSASALTWAISATQQDNMMQTMAFGNMTLNPVTISLFTTIWTIGMAAMMFPAISPMVLLYNRLISNSEKNNQTSSLVIESPADASVSRSIKSILFVGSYLLVWALTGIALFLGWSTIMDRLTAASISQSNQYMNFIYASILIISGAYQFSPLKSKCLGYCESPLSFFMRRWKGGKSGALKMGLYHGLYCLGCCWPYFLLMVALGWMNLLWMGLFAGMIFAEKIWSRGIWVARAAGIGLAVIGVLVLTGMMVFLLPSISSMNLPLNSNSRSMASMDTNSIQNNTSMPNDSTPHSTIIQNNTAVTLPSKSSDEQNSSSQGMPSMTMSG